jgi:hypothetical protein
MLVRCDHVPSRIVNAIRQLRLYSEAFRMLAIYRLHLALKNLPIEGGQFAHEIRKKAGKRFALARLCEAQGSGVCQVVSSVAQSPLPSARESKLNQRGNTSHDSTGGSIDDGALRADHRRRFMLYWAALASDVLITRRLLMIEHASHT